MGVGEPEGGAKAQDRCACGAIPYSQQPNSQAAKQPDSQTTNSQGKT